MHRRILAKPVKIRYTWDHTVIGDNNMPCLITPMHSRSFISKSLPGVKFDILCAMSENKRFTVSLTKTPNLPASATIRILIDGEEKNVENIHGWTTNYAMNDIFHKFFTSIPNYSYYRTNLLFECEITWLGYGDMEQYFNTSELPDMMIIINNEEIPAHKTVLAKESQIFLAILQGNSENHVNNRIFLEDIEPYIMRMVIKYLYTGEIDTELDVNVVLLILEVAEKFQIVRLIENCKRILSTTLNINNAVKILDAIGYDKFPDVYEMTIRFLIANKQAFTNSKAFEILYYQKPDLLSHILGKCTRKRLLPSKKRKHKLVEGDTTLQT